jgi:membrane-bound lytic murein transglycosylase D
MIAAVLLVSTACSSAIHPTTPAEAPKPQSTASSGTTSVSAAGAVAAESAVGVPESLQVQMRDAMASVTAALGIPDSTISEAAPSTVVGPAALTEAEEVAWDIDVTSYLTHDRVAHYVNLFTGPAKSRIQSRLERGKRYEPMIREKFRARGIPEDMYYLGLVESGYDPHAYSRAAAVGMWQFMSTTGRGVGLRIDHWVDERRDPVRSTDAAAKFLNSLQKQFGSYYLAAAAYNGGPGRVSRGLARFQDELEEIEGDDRFFALAEQSYLRSETRNYVPQLIAAALVGKAPEKYGLRISDSIAPFAYDSVVVPPLTSIGAVARAVGVSIDQARDLNPHFLRGVTPPGKPSQVRLPVGMAANFQAQFDSLPEDARAAFSKVTTKKGQTLASIAKGRTVTARMLAWYNPSLSATKRLPVGRTVLIPAGHVIAAARDVPNPSIERYGTSSGGRVVHVVKRGESLGLIARRYRTTVSSLMRTNGLKRTVVYPGQSVIVRRGASRSTTARKASTSRSSTARKATAKKTSQTPARKAPPKSGSVATAKR